MSDERDSAGSAGAGTDAGTDAGESESQGQTAVVTRPARPTGKRARRAVEVDESESDVDTGDTDSDADDSAADAGKKSKPKKAEKSKKTGPTRNPFVFVWNYLKQVVAELRKVIWPNRKQMIGYTTVVLVFLVFMVALIGGVDLGLAKLVMWVFG
ncbi:preprotein translocase subunit SecE [Mycolicibacterium mucogenicum]|uniref:Protein translocase subunit SecE n=1 Tax=Mycolicibacterium mucogenicum TaxID=56689 RepID=A0A1A0MU37_MYCMU|nr:preprotein translocase subunit SecE [Mycolicibacterium mucogenicum]MCX8554675.1 preprotein translocase subunit SecE [Mycolicibacterium mucogenicum]OBA89034.1 preprotein translocase subunit SecE [Mycolicibacterium mucogenicum]TDK93699.1 preprotein translocase subunit SecE [Mycolicibacterium mucogenicum]